MWIQLKAQPSLMLEAQDILRWHNAPVCSVKRRAHGWECYLLECSGISTRPLLLPPELKIEDVRARCEAALVKMGWTQPKGRERDVQSQA